MLQESEDNEAEEEFPTCAPGIAGAVIHKEKLPTPTSTPPPLSSIVDTAKVLNPSSETGSLNTVTDSSVTSESAVAPQAQSRATQLASWLKENPWNPINYNYEAVPTPIKYVATSVASRIIPISLSGAAPPSTNSMPSSAPPAMAERPQSARTSASSNAIAAISSSSSNLLKSIRGSLDGTNSSSTGSGSSSTQPAALTASSASSLSTSSVVMVENNTPPNSPIVKEETVPSSASLSPPPMTRSSLLSRAAFSVTVPHTIGGLVSMLRSYSSWAAAYSPSLFRRFSAVRSPADFSSDGQMTVCTISNEQYNAFVEKLRKAPKLLNRVDNFIIQVLGQDDDVQLDGLAVEAFLLQSQEALTQPPFSCSSTNNDLFLATEALEKYIMLKIHVKAFPSSDADLQRDLELYNWIDSLQFIEERNLDLPAGCTAQEYWSLAQDDLFKLSSDKSPIDKLHSIMRCCKHLFSGLQKSKGADEFLPLFVYLLLRSNPPALLSNIAYITKFRNPDRLQSELGYFFISLVGAVSFIQNLSPAALSNIEPHDFERLLAESRKQSQLRKTSGGAHSNLSSATTTASSSNISSNTSSSAVLQNDDERFEIILDSNNTQKGIIGADDADWVWLKRKGPSTFISSSLLLGGATDKLSTPTSAEQQKVLSANKFLSKDPKSFSTEEVAELLEDYRRLVLLEHQQKRQHAMTKSLEKMFM